MERMKNEGASRESASSLPRISDMARRALRKAVTELFYYRKVVFLPKIFKSGAFVISTSLF
jgi:hypothetical protein